MKLNPFKKSSAVSSRLLGAAFLMATSAIGPGFLTQTTVFTQQLKASFAFVILMTILLDIGAQVNIWRILTMGELRAQDLSNKLLPGLGYFLAILIIIGGLAFNIGNIAGCGLGIQVFTGINTVYGAAISCMIALFIFWMKEAGKALDTFTKYLGFLMIILTMYVAISANPPIVEAIKRSVIPEKIDFISIITLVGGTVGGYISFSGAHRLLDAGVKGPSQLKQVNKSATSGILITAVMRCVLFLASLGVIVGGATLAKTNPPASVFKIAAGQTGYIFFGVVMWCASITSVLGASYTSVSFIKTFHPLLEKYERQLVSFFIIFSTTVFIAIGQPVKILLTVGAINGLILPISLAILLIAGRKKALMKNYIHPLSLQIMGWLVVLLMGYMGIWSIIHWIEN